MVVRGTRYQTSSLQNEFCVWQALSFDYRLQYKISDTGYIGTELKKGTIDQGARVRLVEQRLGPRHDYVLRTGVATSIMYLPVLYFDYCLNELGEKLKSIVTHT